MGRLIFGAMVSLDGYIEDADGKINWSAPEEGLHALANRQAEASAGFVMGRKLYEMMVPYWHDLLAAGEGEEVELEFARIWASKPKYVASRTLTEVHESCELIEGDAVGTIARMKEEIDGDLDIGNADLAAELEAADLIDVYRLMVLPVVLGAGKRYFRDGHPHRELELTSVDRFPGGSVALEYTVKD